MDKIPLVVVAGPTASGKTALSIEIAKRYNGEVISADSMQIYKHMDIGTAKPTEEEKAGIPHHMIDIAEPYENFSVALYAKMARQRIEDVYARKKLPVMAGGTGLYIDNVLQNIKLAQTNADTETREKLTALAEKNGNDYMYGLLKKEDPKAAENIHPNNIRRVIRALEVCYTSGSTFSSQIENSKLEESPYKSICFMPEWDRNTLYSRIDARVDMMFEAGLYDEFEKLIHAGCKRTMTSMQAIGYRELIDCYRGLCSIDEAKELIKRHSRRYAKRQLTWFKRNDDIIHLKAPFDNMIKQCFERLDNFFASDMLTDKK